MGVILDIIPVVTAGGGSVDLSEVNEKIEAQRLEIQQLEKQVESVKAELSKYDIQYLD